MEVLIAVVLGGLALIIALYLIKFFFVGAAAMLSDGGFIVLALFIFAFPVMAVISVLLGACDEWN